MDLRSNETINRKKNEAREEKIFAMQTQANQILGRTLISWGPNKFENWTSASSVVWKFLLSCWEGVGGPTNNLFRPNSGWSWIRLTVGLGCDNTYLTWKCIQLNIGAYLSTNIFESRADLSELHRFCWDLCMHFAQTKCLAVLNCFYRERGPPSETCWSAQPSAVHSPH